MTITKYKTPDTAIFGLNSERERVFFGDIRRVQNNKELIELFKIRHKEFFINQVQVLDDNKSAFPLTHMVIFGIEGFAKILSGTENIGYKEVCSVLEQISPLFLEKANLPKYVEFWDDRIWELNDNVSYIFYNLSFCKRKRGYVLDYDKDVTLEEWENTFLRLNPGWLWNQYKNFIETVFDNLTEEQETLITNYIRTELLV